MTTPADIMAKALAPYQDDALRKLVMRAGVSREEARRAQGGARGRITGARIYIRLCLTLGIDPIDGRAITPEPPRDIAAHNLAIAIRMRRIALRHNIREGAEVMGISITTLSRIENGNMRSIDTMLAACRYIGKHPFDCLHPVDTRETLAGNKNERNAAALSGRPQP